MKMYDELQLQREADHTVLTIKEMHFICEKKIKVIICLITGLIIKFITYTISKILRKVKIALTRL